MTGVLTGDIRSTGICFTPTACGRGTNQVAPQDTLLLGVLRTPNKGVGREAMIGL